MQIGWVKKDVDINSPITVTSSLIDYNNDGSILRKLGKDEKVSMCLPDNKLGYKAGHIIETWYENGQINFANNALCEKD